MVFHRFIAPKGGMLYSRANRRSAGFTSVDEMQGPRGSCLDSVASYPVMRYPMTLHFMPRTIRLVLLSMGTMLLAACDFRTMIEKFTPKEAEAYARQFIEEISRGDIEAAEKRLRPEIAGPQTRQGLQQIQQLFASGRVVKIEQIGVVTVHMSGRQQIDLPYQVEMSDGWIAGNVVVISEEGDLKISTGRFNRYPESLGKINAFTLQGKSLRHYFILLIALVTPLFCIATGVYCLRSKVRRKWLWVPFILVGFGIVRLNWTTGEGGYGLLNVQLLGASAFKSGLYAPWMLGVSFPLGAVLFLCLRSRLLMQAPNVSLPPTIPPAS